MDLMDFEGQELYFDEALSDEVKQLVAQASAEYADGTAELPLLRAYLRVPESLSVLVSLYRFYYYQHRLEETYLIAQRSLEVSGRRLGFPADWRELSAEHLALGAEKSMSLVRFYLLALKGAGWLKMRLNLLDEAKPILEKLASLDTANRLGIKDLLDLATDIEKGGDEDEG